MATLQFRDYADNLELMKNKNKSYAASLQDLYDMDSNLFSTEVITAIREINQSTDLGFSAFVKWAVFEHINIFKNYLNNINSKTVTNQIIGMMTSYFNALSSSGLTGSYGNGNSLRDKVFAILRMKIRFSTDLGNGQYSTIKATFETNYLPNDKALYTNPTDFQNLNENLLCNALQSSSEITINYIPVASSETITIGDSSQAMLIEGLVNYDTFCGNVSKSLNWEYTPFVIAISPDEP